MSGCYSYQYILRIAKLGIILLWHQQVVEYLTWVNEGPRPYRLSEKFNLLYRPFTYQNPITPFPILPPYLPHLSPRPHHSFHCPNYQTVRHGSNPITIHSLVTIHLISLNPDMTQRDIFLWERIRRLRSDNVAFEGYDALDGEDFGIHRGPNVATTTHQLSTLPRNSRASTEQA